MIVLTPHRRVLALAGSAAGRAALTRLLSTVTALLTDQEQAGAVLARAAADLGWQCQFEAAGDMLNLLACELHQAMPTPAPGLRHGSTEWYAEQCRRHVMVRDALNRRIDAAESALVFA